MWPILHNWSIHNHFVILHKREQSPTTSAHKSRTCFAAVLPAVELYAFQCAWPQEDDCNVKCLRSHHLPASIDVLRRGRFRFVRALIRVMSELFAQEAFNFLIRFLLLGWTLPRRSVIPTSLWSRPRLLFPRIIRLSHDHTANTSKRMKCMPCCES